MTSEIKFPAEVQKVQTLADGGIRVTLDLPETEIPAMAMLAECKRQGIYLIFVVKEEEST
jgi:hypothetical protein